MWSNKNEYQSPNFNRVNRRKNGGDDRWQRKGGSQRN